METSSSDAKIEKSKLLQKHTYIKTTLYIIQKTKLNQSLQPIQRKFSWDLELLAAIPFILLTRVKIWIITNYHELNYAFLDTEKRRLTC